MLDRPDANAVLREVQAALKAGISPGFQQTVAANAVELALRESELGPAAHKAEAARLASLMGRQGSAEDLNGALAEAIRDGTLEDSAIAAHLILTTIEKMEVDQPNYPAYRAWKAGMQ